MQISIGPYAKGVHRVPGVASSIVHVPRSVVDPAPRFAPHGGDWLRWRALTGSATDWATALIIRRRHICATRKRCGAWQRNAAPALMRRRRLRRRLLRRRGTAAAVVHCNAPAASIRTGGTRRRSCALRLRHRTRQGVTAGLRGGGRDQAHGGEGSHRGAQPPMARRTLAEPQCRHAVTHAVAA